MSPEGSGLLLRLTAAPATASSDDGAGHRRQATTPLMPSGPLAARGCRRDAAVVASPPAARGRSRDAAVVVPPPIRPPLERRQRDAAVGTLAPNRCLPEATIGTPPAEVQPQLGRRPRPAAVDTASTASLDNGSSRSATFPAAAPTTLSGGSSDDG